MSEVHYQTFPGTNGFFVSTTDVNLLDADTAHIQQSKGSWIDNSITGTVLNTTRSMFGDSSLRGTYGGGTSAVVRFADGTNGVPTVESDVRAVGVWLWTDESGLEAKASVLWNDSGGSFISAVDGSYIALTQNGWTFVSASGTAAASTAHVGVQIDAKVIAGGSISATTFWFDQASIRSGTDATFTPSTRIVGNVDMRALVALTDYTAAANQTLIHKAASNNGYSLQVTTGGELLAWHGDGTDYNAGTSSGASLTNVAVYELRATLNVTTGTWTYYKDGASFDTDSVGAVTPVPDETVDLLVGAATSSTLLIAGDLYFSEVRDGIDGPAVRRYSAQNAWDTAQ